MGSTKTLIPIKSMRNFYASEFENNLPFRPHLLATRYYSGGAGESSGSTTPQLSPQDMLALYAQAVSPTSQIVANTGPGITQSMAASAYGANPIYTQSVLNQLAGQSGNYQQAGAALANMQANSQAGLLANGGAAVDQQAAALANQYNPAQAAANGQAANLVNSINLNGLSGGEQAAAERSLNQSNYATGNLGVDNATNAVSNAMNFGNALNTKRQMLGSALGTAANVSGAQNATFNPVATAAGAGNTANNFGLAQFNPTQANSTTSTPFSFASSFGNQLAGIGAASKGTTSSGNASAGCFLTTAACDYKGLPDDCDELQTLRKFRDKHVPQHIVEEYYRLAPAITQCIQNNPEELEYIWGVVQRCIGYIRNGKASYATLAYTKMVKTLTTRYGIHA